MLTLNAPDTDYRIIGHTYRWTRDAGLETPFSRNGHPHRVHTAHRWSFTASCARFNRCVNLAFRTQPMVFGCFLDTAAVFS